MPSETLPFRLRLERAFRTANSATTPAFVVSTVVNGIVHAVSAYLAMKVTGLEPFVKAFCEAHGWLLLKTFAVYIVLYPVFFVPGRYMFAFLKGLFGLHENPLPVRA